jgi:uncharacterized damage-inducible protein DinB
MTVPSESDDGRALIAAWRTVNRATTFLIENLPPEIWAVPIPGVPRRTVRAIAAHIHNGRRGWIKSLGERHGAAVPESVDGRSVRPAGVVRALTKSSEGIIDLIRLGVARGGTVPSAVWQNFPTDLTHFLCYFVAHEGYHQGQICLIARQLGHRLSAEVRGGIWQWKKRAKE